MAENGPAPEKAAKRRPRPNQQRFKNKSRSTQQKQKELTAQPKFLQITSLAKKFKPVTINGSPTKTILDQIRQLAKDQPDYFSQYKNSARLSVLQKYFLEFIRLHPESTIYISFAIKMDEEFPFDLDLLKLNLSIPSCYPSAPPTIVVLNDDIPRGYAINIEVGFNKIIKVAMTQKPDSINENPIILDLGNNLKSYFLTLMTYVEECLKQEKKQTIRIVKVKGKQKESKVEETVPKEAKAFVPVAKPLKPLNTNTPLHVLNKRNQLIQEMVNKLPVKLFKKSILGNQYKLNVDKKIDDINTVDLLIDVPRSYPINPISVKFLTSSLNQYDVNINTNISNYDFNSSQLIVVLNKLVNNLSSFILSNEDFQNWKEMVKQVKGKNLAVREGS